MNWIFQSRAYRKAKRLVSATIESQAKLLSLANSAQQKAAKQASAKLADLLEPIKTSYRLIRAYASGTYRDISVENFGLIVAAIIYFVMPLDALPDFIAGLGFADDAAVLAWTFRKVNEELARFLHWETSQAEQNKKLPPQ
jgi:uncharacterized membrane protein YkvA (DUF1232 family)